MADLEILHVRQLAQMFGISPDAVRKRFQRGQFGPARKIGRKWVITSRQLAATVEGAPPQSEREGRRG